MAEEPLTPPDSIEEEEGGGPVKPFLEHLEDLRWTIIRVLAAVIISMIACLVASDKLFALLYWPLQQAQKLSSSNRHFAVLRVGQSTLGSLAIDPADTNLWKGKPPVAFQLSPFAVGTNLILGLVADTNAPVQGTLDPGIVAIKGYGPMSAISVALELSLFGGLTLASPFVMFFLGQFIVPALHRRERMFVYRAMGIGIGLFVIGVVFAYFIIMQITLLATVQFSQWMGLGADEWRADEYVDFILKMMLAVGLSFQLPVIILTLVKLGILDYKKLAHYRSYFIVVNMVACAVVTPSADPFSMLLLAVPVQLLYEGSVVVAWLWWRRERKEQEALEAAGGA